MTLRLALVIEGDAKGAKAALDETSKGINDLASKAGGAAEGTERTAGAIDRLADRAKEAAPALGRVSRDASQAAEGIAGAGGAAAAAQGRIGQLSTVLATLGGALAGGVIAAGIALIADEAVRWFGAILDHEARVKAVLEEHDTLVGRIADKYKAAARGAHDYGAESAAVLRFEAQQNVPALDEAFLSEARFTAMVNANRREAFGVGIGELGPFEEATRRLINQIADGTPDVIAFRDEIAQLAAALDETDPLRAWADEAVSVFQTAAELQGEVERARDALRGMEGDSDAASRALGTLPKAFQDASDAANAQADAVSRLRRELQELGGGVGSASGSGATGGSPGPSQGETPGFFGRLSSLFATGGIVTSPTLFGYGGGSLGLMGEAGPEAIMPLTSTARGLAVEASDQSGGRTTLPVSRLSSGKLGVNMTARPFASGGVIGAVRGGIKGFSHDLLDGVDAADALGNAVLRLSDRLVDMALDNLLDSILGGGGSGSAGLFGGLVDDAGVGGLVGSIFGGFRAQGGPLDPGKWYVAGEDGPEPVWGGGPGAFAAPLPAVGQVASRPAAAAINNFYISTPNPKAFVENRGQVVRGAARFMAQTERHT